MADGSLEPVMEPAETFVQFRIRKGGSPMRMLLAATVIAGLAAGAALAATTPQQQVMKDGSAKWTAMSAADKGKTKRTAFMSSCMKAPATSAAAATPAMTMKASGSGAMAMKPAAAGSMAMTAKPASGSM